MPGQGPLFIGIRGTVLALDPAIGTELWRARVKGMDFVNVALVEGGLYATARGEVFALDPTTGHVLWHNKLKGLGFGLVTVAGSDQASPSAEAIRRRRARAAAGGAAAGAGAAGRLGGRHSSSRAIGKRTNLPSA